MPYECVSKQTRATWLLEVCKENVLKFVFNKDELASLVEQTTELEAVNQQSRWKCRAVDCEMSYKYHSGRVRYMFMYTVFHWLMKCPVSGCIKTSNYQHKQMQTLLLKS